MINQKHPPQMGAAQYWVRQNVNEVSIGNGRHGGCGGFGQGGRGGRNYTGHSGHGPPRKTRTDSRFITLTDGTQIEYHASFNFPRHVFAKMRPEDKETLRCKRQTYNATRQNCAEIQELRSQVQELGHTVATQSTPPTDTISVSQSSQVSQLTTTNNSIMGGRNEQTQNRQARRAGAVTTRHHIQSSTTVNRSWIDPPENTCADNECDTNADTCCLARYYFIVLTARFCTADVYAYVTSIQPIANVPIVSLATAYDNPVSGNTDILVFHKSLYNGGKLDQSLLNPNQLRAYGIHLWDNPFDPLRSLSINVNPTLTIPLRAHGTKIAFRTQLPTATELCTCEHIAMTSPILGTLWKLSWCKPRIKAEVDHGNDN